MSTITAVAMMIVLASIVYEFTVVSRFITEQKLKHPRMSADWRR